VTSWISGMTTRAVLQRRRGVQLLSPSRAAAASSPRSHRLPAPPGRCLWHTDESPPFFQTARRCYAENTCCKCMF
jgi:hypothetical protein